jgi:hypothetical protein
VDGGTNKRDEQLTKRGVQGGTENVARLRAYVERLKVEGRRLPSRAGMPDKSAIARECGFNRQTLYPENNPKAAALLASVAEEIGLEDAAPKGRVSVLGKVEHLERRADREGRRCKLLEDRLQICEAEKLELREKLRGLEEQLRMYRHLEELMASNGRRLRL